MTQPRTGPGKEGQIRYFENQKQKLLERWPQRILITGQLELLHETTAGLWLSKADLFSESAPTFGKPVRLSGSSVGVMGGRVLLDGDTVFLPAGAESTPSILSAPIESLLAPSVND